MPVLRGWQTGRLDELWTLVRAIDALNRVERRNGGVGPDVHRIRAELMAAIVGESSESPARREAKAHLSQIADSGRPTRKMGTKEAARALGTSEVTVRHLCRTGTLPAVKIAEAWRIEPLGVELLARRKNP